MFLYVVICGMVFCGVFCACCVLVLVVLCRVLCMFAFCGLWWAFAMVCAVLIVLRIMCCLCVVRCGLVSCVVFRVWCVVLCVVRSAFGVL